MPSLAPSDPLLLFLTIISALIVSWCTLTKPVLRGLSLAIALAASAFLILIDHLPKTANTAPVQTQTSTSGEALPRNGLDTGLEAVFATKSCDYAKSFAAENQSTRYGAIARAWFDENCLIEPPDIPTEVRDERIAILQRELNRLNCYIGPISGRWNPLLQEGIENLGSATSEQLSFNDIHHLLALVKTTTRSCPNYSSITTGTP